MKRCTIQTLSTILATLLLGSFAQAADSPTKEEEALMQRERDAAQAFLKRDAKVVGEWEADKYVFTNFDGAVSDKATDIAGLNKGTLTFTSFDVSDMKAMVYGDMGVVVGRIVQKGMYEQSDLSGVFRFTDTYVKRDGRWQCVASQVTRIEKP
jgi:Domain of unknown function (DUF4440)